jgi:hypothetical protein
MEQQHNSQLQKEIGFLLVRLKVVNANKEQQQIWIDRYAIAYPDFQYWSDPKDQPTEQGGAANQAGPSGSKQLPCG